MEAAWARVSGVAPAVTGKRSWNSGCASRRDFMVVPLLQLLWSTVMLMGSGGFNRIWQLNPFWALSGGPVELLGLLLVLLFGLVIDKSRGSRSVEVQRGLERVDDRLQFMALLHIQALEDALVGHDVFVAWIIWSSAAESAHAFRLAGWPLPARRVCGRGVARFRTVRLGGPRVRRARSCLSDSCEGRRFICVL